jgi:hypothetical protein
MFFYEIFLDLHPSSSKLPFKSNIFVIKDLNMKQKQGRLKLFYS